MYVIMYYIWYLFIYSKKSLVTWLGLMYEDKGIVSKYFYEGISVVLDPQDFEYLMETLKLLDTKMP